MLQLSTAHKIKTSTANNNEIVIKGALHYAAVGNRGMLQLQCQSEEQLRQHNLSIYLTKACNGSSNVVSPLPFLVSSARLFEYTHNSVTVCAI